MVGGVSLFTCFDNLSQLTGIIDGGGESVTTNLVVSTADRALRSVGSLLQRVLSPVEVDAAEIKGSAEEAVATVTQLTGYVMTSILPCLWTANQRKKRRISTWTGSMTSCAAVDEILGLVARWVCVPVIRTLYSLSVRWASRLFVTGSSQRKKRTCGSALDLRPNLVCLVKDLVTSVEELLGCGADRLRDILAVETLRELEKLEEDPCGGDADLDERVRRLARKDGIWHLCDVMMWLFCPRGRKVSVPLGGSQETLLRDDLLRTLSRLVTARDGRARKRIAGIGNGDGGGCKGAAVTVERGLLVSTLETVWAFGMALPDNCEK